jgi:hypothetical protein
MQANCEHGSKQLFGTFREHHPEKIFSSIKTIMILFLEESENISLDLLSPILDCLNKDSKVRVWKFNLIDHDYETGDCLKQSLQWEGKGLYMLIYQVSLRISY